jgi:hypothetical protein
MENPGNRPSGFLALGDGRLVAATIRSGGPAEGRSGARAARLAAANRDIPGAGVGVASGSVSVSTGDTTQTRPILGRAHSYSELA